jgi:PKD repeat protein
VDSGNVFYSSVNGVLFDRSQTTLIEYPGGRAGSYTIPGTVTNIASNAFEDCFMLTSVTIPDSVISIGEETFAACIRLTNAIIGGRVTSIGEAVFENCDKLASVMIGNGVTSIEEYAFLNCYDLASVYCEGNAPYAAGTAFTQDNNPTIYYLPGATGWFTDFDGFPTSELTGIATTAYPVYGLVPFQVNFTSQGYDIYGGPVGNLNWNFGDGSSSAYQNPSHTYTTPGTFCVALIETNDDGVPIAGAAVTITASTPALVFTANPTSGVVPLTVSFASQAVDSYHNAITSWSWNFGDGSTSTLQNPTHTYASPGIFYPTLAAINNIGGLVTGSGPAPITVHSAPVYSGLVLNGGFETGDFTGWTLTGDANYAYVDQGYVMTPQSGNYEAALETSGSPGQLSQTLSTTAGASYLLSFWFDNPYGNPGMFSVSWNGNALLDTTNPEADNWTNMQFLVLATGPSTVLQFGYQDDDFCFGLDDISVVPAKPGIAGLRLSGTNLVLNGSNGQAGRTYYVLTSTNLHLPLSQWTRVATNVLSASGNFTLTVTNTVSPNVPQRFYILQAQSGASSPTPPAISIQTANQTVNNSAFTVTGTASDNVAVAGVYYQLNGGSWALAATPNAWTNWTAAVTLIPGTNVIAAYALDTSGNVSATNTVNLFYEVTSVLTLLMNGNGMGSVSPITNGEVLLVGRSYTITATAAPGSVFINWTGGANGQDSVLTSWPTLEFMMVSNLVLEADFEAQPGLAGASLSGTSLVLNGVNGHSGSTYYVLMSTNLALPLSQWTPVATNVLSASGNFTITATNTVNRNVPHRFYILETQ